MKIENYIAALLYRYQCVIVPEFGAFLSEMQSAQLVDGSNSFYPPKKLISFNSFLKNNDGLLANHISATENCSYDTAVQNIKIETALWRNGLQNNQSLVIKNIGTLELNTEGNVIFKPSHEINFYTGSFGLNSFIAPPIKRTEVLSENILEKNAVEEETVIVHPALKSKANYLKYAAVLMIGLGTASYFGNTFYQNQILKETQLVQTEVQKEVQQKIQEATFFIPTPLPNVTLSIKETKMYYHVVAGAFRNEKNAQRIYEKLSKLGYKSKRVEKNKFGLFPVLYGSYPTYAEAQKAMRTIHKNQSSEAWLLIKDFK